MQGSCYVWVLWQLQGSVITECEGTTMAKVMQFAASNVSEGVIPDSGHWIMEENPTATISMVRAFLDANA